jgi:hypothetical protein
MSLNGPEAGCRFFYKEIEKFLKKGEKMDPEKIMDGLSRELNSALKAMAKTKKLEEKEAYSRIVKNLCESQGVYLTLASEMMPYDFEDYSDEGDTPF